MSGSLSTSLRKLGATEILNALADGAYITDLRRNIVFWSRGAERITGWKAQDVVGRSCNDNVLVHVDIDGHALCGQEHCPLHRAIVTGEISSGPLLVFAQHKKGHRIPVEVSVAPIRDAKGHVIGGIEVFRDLAGVMDDLKRAKAIQEHALDCRLHFDERVAIEVRYSPQEVVGGDFYRVEQIEDDRCAIMVADVMGHGVASALYTMQLRSLWEDCRHELASPAAFLGALNRRLHKLVSDEGYFATAACVTLDLVTGRLLYVRAGHPAPLLFGARGEARPLEKQSPLLGLCEHATFADTAERLEPGATLLLFSDGAVEVCNAAGRELGETGLMNLLTQEGFATGKIGLEQVEEKLLAYSGRLRLSDDLTLLRVQRRPSSH
jgi:PAS domain S-box-containing protein